MIPVCHLYLLSYRQKVQHIDTSTCQLLTMQPNSQERDQRDKRMMYCTARKHAGKWHYLLVGRPDAALLSDGTL